MLCLPVMLLVSDARSYISLIMVWEASLAGRGAITHDGASVRLHKRWRATVGVKEPVPGGV